MERDNDLNNYTYEIRDKQNLVDVVITVKRSRTEGPKGNSSELSSTSTESRASTQKPAGLIVPNKQEPVVTHPATGSYNYDRTVAFADHLSFG
jgi:hypothetical protein